MEETKVSIEQELENLNLKLSEDDVKSGVSKLKVLEGKKGADISQWKIDEKEFNVDSNVRNKGKYKIKDLDKVCRVIVEEKGLRTKVCKRLGISLPTIYNMIKRHSKIRDAFQAADDKILDICENALVDKILARDTAAICFMLKTKGRKRGYVETSEIIPPERPVFVMKKKPVKGEKE